MSIKNENICRLCLKVIEKQFEIDKYVRQIFDILLIKLDLGITRNPIICQDCMEVAKKCLNFKYTCINTEEVILSYSTDRKKVKPDIGIISEERKHVQTAFDEDLHICRFCMIRWERNNLNTLINERMFEMSELMPEMDFSVIENPIICAKCRENLDGYFKFVLICVDVEKKIKAYCDKYGTESAGKVKLSNVVVFMSRDTLEYPNKCSQTCKIKQDHIEYAHNELIKQEELDIKDEERILTEKINRHAICTDKTRERKKMGTIFKCSLCAYECKHKSTLNRHTLVHKNASEIEMFKCSLCTYESKHKSNLKAHMLVHKDVSQLKMFKCLLCGKEYKLKSILKTHMLLHRSVLEVNMLKCTFCAYRSKNKHHLKKHMLVHKDVSERKMFKCTLCSYEHKNKSSLKTHMLLHSEVKMFKCSLCSYECKQNSSLVSHMLIHKDVSEIKMFKCSLCAFESKRKRCLVAHMLIHKDVSEIKMFKCSLCAFESKRKGNLKSHMLVHKDVSEIKMFKCSLCTFETKHKRSLETHMLVHKGHSNI